MLNTVYQLKRPRQFEVAFKEMEIDDRQVIVRPTRLSICHADQRYYQGARAEEILRQKLPMALIHEGIGKVIYDPTGTFEIGTEVVMIPNRPVEKDDIIAENYLRSSKFCASSMDGFLQEYVQAVPDRFVRLPQGINPTVAAYTELVSVSFHAINRFLRFSHERRDVIGVWGGVNEIPADMQIDHAFECVGGGAASKAINQIIDYIHPEGTISILGVSEDPAPINTRMVLEKGLRIFGSSRSGRSDYEGLLQLYEEHPEVVSYLENIMGAEVEVRDVKDITRAFEMDIHKLMGKTVMIWNE